MATLSSVTRQARRPGGIADFLRQAVEQKKAQQTAAANSRYGRQGLLNQQQEEMTYQRDTARRADKGYMDFAEDFDASEALNQWAQGAYSDVSAGIKDQLGTLAGQSVGAGRLDTGFYDEDQGEVITDNMAQFNNALSQQALNAAQLQAGVKGGMADFGTQRTGEANDLLMSRREEVENDRREKNERRRRRRSGIGGAIGGALGAGVGFLAGGPGGAAAGWKYGSQAGSAF